MLIRPFQVSDTDAVVALWREAGLVRPQNDPHTDIARKLLVQPELFLVGEKHDRVIGSVMGGYEGRRGWINYLAVAQSVRGEGHGRALVGAIERLLAERGCPKVNLQVREGNDSVVGFYEALGYLIDPVISLGKRLTP